MPVLTRSQARALKLAEEAAAQLCVEAAAQLCVEATLYRKLEPLETYLECAVCAEETCEEGLAACEACAQKLCLDCQDRVKSCPFCRFVSALHAHESKTITEDSVWLEDLEWNASEAIPFEDLL